MSFIEKLPRVIGNLHDLHPEQLKIIGEPVSRTDGLIVSGVEAGEDDEVIMVVSTHDLRRSVTQAYSREAIKERASGDYEQGLRLIGNLWVSAAFEELSSLE